MCWDTLLIVCLFDMFLDALSRSYSSASDVEVPLESQLRIHWIIALLLIIACRFGVSGCNAP